MPIPVGRMLGQPPFQSGTTRRTRRAHRSRVMSLVWCALLCFLCSLNRSAYSQVEIPATSLNWQEVRRASSLLPTIEDGGYATTNFTPPWTTTQALTIFATSSTQNGNLGGLEGARSLCQSLANAVPALAGTTWYPLLSDSTYDASSLTGKSSSSAPIYNINGSVIAVNRASLWSGGALSTGVKGTETGAIRYDSVFTGTTATGSKSASLCSNWTSTSGNGTIGATNETSLAWIGGFLTSCAVSYRLFCIGNYDPYQVAPSPSPTPTSTRTPTPLTTSTPTPTPNGGSTFTPPPESSPIGPTSSPTPTSTPQGTPSPTPSVSSVSVQVLIELTPVPSLPLKIGARSVNTNQNGYASAALPSSTFVTIETDLPAVVFTPITGTAAGFRDHTVIIDATRLIIPSPDICSVMVGNVPHLWFPYTNIGGTAFSVPLSLFRLNRVLSPSGLAAPAGIFAPGESGNGFSLPRSHFESGASVSGTWEFLATAVSMPPSPLPCAEQGAPAPPSPTPNAACTVVDLSVLFKETQRAIASLSEESLKAAARREWKPKGNVREPFLKGGALALTKMRSTVKLAGPNLQSCGSADVPSNCSIKQLNKTSIKRDFAFIFPKYLPSGLRRVKKRIPSEIAKFSRIVDALPGTVYSCP